MMYSLVIVAIIVLKLFFSLLFKINVAMEFILLVPCVGFFTFGCSVFVSELKADS